MNLELPLVHFCRQLISFSGCLVHSQSCSTQENDSSIKFYRTHQMVASTAPPSSLFSTCWVFPVKGKCAAGSSQWTLLLSASLSICASKFGHRFLYNLGTRSTALSVAPRSCFCPTTVAVSLPTLYPTAPTTPGVSIRSFCRSGTDRPFRPICSSPSADFQSCCVQFLTNSPCDPHTMMPTS